MSSDFRDAGALDRELARLQAGIDELGSTRLRDTAAEVGREAQDLDCQLRGIAASKAAQPGRETAGRGRIDKMSGEVVDWNPYSRLMALQRMGIVADYERIRQMTVAVVGMGGVGSVAAEMLTRCGIGRLLMYDYDKVELANMNRLFFRPEQAGMTKTDAAAQTLAGINPDVRLESYTMNVTTLDGFDRFRDSLTDGSGISRVDLVLSCVDNYEARMTINEVCLDLDQTWMESGVSEDAVSGHIQVVIPGETACFACVPPLVVASGIDERTLKREGVCAASLPTTMGVIAGFLVQNTLKHLLNFGQVTRYLGYSSLTDFFPTMEIKPNPGCANGLCRQRQAAYLRRYSSPAAVAARQAAQHVAQPEAAPPHEENEWKIEVVPEERPAEVAVQPSHVTQGVRYEYPVTEHPSSKKAQESFDDSREDLDSLLAELNELGK